MRDYYASREMVAFQSTSLQPDQSRAISATDPRALAAEGQLRDFAKPLRLRSRVRDLAVRLEAVALIAAHCGQTIPPLGRPEVRVARFLRGLETDGDFRREVMRLETDGELADLAERLKSALKPAGADLIADAFALMLASAPNIVATGPAYVMATESTIADFSPSIAALLLACDDYAGAEDRKYGRAPTQFEIDAALERRETECEEWCGVLNWLAEHAQALPGIIAAEKAAAEAEERRQKASVAECEARQAAAEAKRQREAEAKRAAEAKEAADKAEVEKLIAAGKFTEAQALSFFLFPRAANAFLANPTAAPKTVAALHAFQREEANRRARDRW